MQHSLQFPFTETKFSRCRRGKFIIFMRDFVFSLLSIEASVPFYTDLSTEMVADLCYWHESTEVLCAGLGSSLRDMYAFGHSCFQSSRKSTFCREAELRWLFIAFLHTEETRQLLLHSSTSKKTSRMHFIHSSLHHTSRITNSFSALSAYPAIESLSFPSQLSVPFFCTLFQMIHGSTSQKMSYRSRKTPLTLSDWRCSPWFNRRSYPAVFSLKKTSSWGPRTTLPTRYSPAASLFCHDAHFRLLNASAFLVSRSSDHSPQLTQCCRLLLEPILARHEQIRRQRRQHSFKQSRFSQNLSTSVSDISSTWRGIALDGFFQAFH